MLQPAKEGAYTLEDVRRARPQSALLFNTLFNLHKFLAFENRDPFALRAESMGEDGQVVSDWDRCGGGGACRGRVPARAGGCGRGLAVVLPARGGGGTLGPAGSRLAALIPGDAVRSALTRAR
jgi:hypothetical protein